MPKGIKLCYHYFPGSSPVERKRTPLEYYKRFPQGRTGWWRSEGSISVNTKIKHPEEDPRLSHKKSFFFFTYLTKEKVHSMCLLTSSGRGETVLEETLEAGRLHRFKVGKDISPYTPCCKNFHQKRKEIWTAIVLQFWWKVDIGNKYPCSSKWRQSCLIKVGNQGDISMADFRLYIFST